MTDILDAEFAEQRQMVVAQRADISNWTPSFAVTVDRAVAIKREKERFFREVMVEGMHYGVIPGTGTKPTLLKAGAEMLIANMGLNSQFCDDMPPVLDYMGIDHGGEPLIKYNRMCKIYRQTGPTEFERVLIGQASGSCSSWEPKYRYRNASRVCPSCGVSAIMKSKFEDKPGFFCFKKKDGCGANFKLGDVRITGQEEGKVANPDVAELDNTILKMADKRALVAATLIATGCSDIFTQDLEDMTPTYEVQNVSPAKPKINPEAKHRSALDKAVSAYKSYHPEADRDTMAANICRHVEGHFGLEKTPTKSSQLTVEQLTWAADHFTKLREAAVTA